MKKSLFLGCAALLALASCTQEEVVDMAKKNAINFTAFANKSTKGVISDLTVQGQTFGMFGYKSKGTETNVTVFNNQLVKYENNAWTYSPSRYWDNGYSYEFYAYAPSKKGVTVTCDPDSSKMKLVDFEVSDTIAKQIDFLVAHKMGCTISTTPIESVNFTFRHMLTKVSFLFKKAKGDQVTKVNSIKLIEVPAKGTCNISFSENTPIADWEIDDSSKKTYEFTHADGVALEADKSSLIGGDLLMIPQALPDTLNLEVRFTVNDEAFVRVINLAALSTAYSWEYNTNLNYTLTINNGSDGDLGNMIVVGVEEVESWEEQEDKEQTGNVPE